MVLRIVCDVFFLVSLVFALAGTKGIIKMPDTFSRMQASTCVATLGVLGVVIGGIRQASARTSPWKQMIWGGISMSSLMIILDVFVILGLVVSAILAVHFEKLLSAVIALSVSGIFAAAAFLIMHAPDVAISEAAVGAALSPLIFIVALKKIRGGDDK